MTVMFADVKSELKGNGYKYRVEGAMFDEILFADDTICVTRDTRTMNKMLSAVEKIGWKSGMRLNKGKCEALQFGGKSKIVFHNKTPVKIVEKSKYLGCVLNKSNNVITEVRGRIREAMGILKRLHRFIDTATAN